LHRELIGVLVNEIVYQGALAGEEAYAR